MTTGTVKSVAFADGLAVSGSTGGALTNPMTTQGDVIYSSDSSGTPARLAAGTKGQRLRTGGSGANPSWGFGSVNVVSSAAYTITDADGYDVIAVSTGASNRSITLPSAANNAGRRITLIKTDSGAGAIAIGNATITGMASELISTQNGYCVVVSDGTTWYYESDICESGTWTTGAAVSTNVTGTPTVTKTWWTRRANMVHFQFKVTGLSVTTAASTRSLITFNIPIALRTAGDPINGTILVAGATEDRGMILYNSGTANAAATWLASITGAVTLYVSGSYALL